MGSLKRAHDALEGNTTPVADKAKWLELMAASRGRTNNLNSFTWREPFAYAFYSSLTNAITTDPTMMIVPVDDHQFVRGHALFESAALTNGRVYRIEAHLDRFLDGAKKARIPLPFPGDEEANRKRMRQIVLDTCVAGGGKNGMIRFSLSAGTGHFGVTPEGCEQAFYCVIYPDNHPRSMTGHKEVTTRDVPTKPKILAEMKSTNYMLNALMYMDAQERGGYQGIWILPNGNVAETCGSGLCFITKDRKLITPDFPGILPSTTIRRLMELGEKLKEKGLVTEVLRQDICEADARKADEIIKMGGGVHINPVTEWDDQKVGTGEVGPVAKELQRMITEESQNPTSYNDSIKLKYSEPISAETNGVINKSAWLEGMKAARQRTMQKANLKEPPAYSFYSSLTDAITTDIDMMFIPADDRGFVRGHAIFESIVLTNGRIYRLQAHLDRFFSGRKKARIPLPFPGDEDENRKRMTQVITDTCTAAGFLDGAQIRLFMSGGSGHLGVSPKGFESTFYCVVHSMTGLSAGLFGKGVGHAEVTTTVPTKPAMLAEMKSNNYMLNSLMKMDAQDRGGNYGIWVHENGNVAETCGSGLVFVTKDGVLRTPKWEGILPSRTVMRVLEVARGLKEKGLLKDVRQEDIPVAEAKACAEVIMCTVGIFLTPVTTWDGKKVGTGEVGPVAKELVKIIHEEAKFSTTYEDVIQLKYPPSAKAAKVHIV